MSWTPEEIKDTGLKMMAEMSHALEHAKNVEDDEARATMIDVLSGPLATAEYMAVHGAIPTLGHIYNTMRIPWEEE